MSSCNVTSNKCAISPASNGDEAFKRSCNAETATGAVVSPRMGDSSIKSSTCAIKESCNGAALSEPLAPYPGCAARQACTRATWTGSEKYAVFCGLLSHAAWLAALLAAWQALAEQYFCRPRLRWSRSKKSPQLKHLRCPDCAIAAPRSGREGQPRRPRSRPQAKSEENKNKPEENASKTMFRRRRGPKNTHVHSG